MGKIHKGSEVNIPGHYNMTYSPIFDKTKTNTYQTLLF
jgi:hypothetical protein